jgi:hypothetical protein
MVRGQHDIYMRSEPSPTTVLVLSQAGVVQLLDNTTVGIADGVAVTGCPYGGTPILPTKSMATNILVIHAPISDVPIPMMPDYTDAKKFAEKHRDYQLILCGDIHRHFLIQTKYNTILNTGPMIRREATEYNFGHQPCFYLYDTETKELKREIIPHAPADQIMTRKHLETAKETQAIMVDFVERIRKTMDKEFPKIDVASNFARAMEGLDLPKSTKDLIMEVVDATGK